MSSFNKFVSFCLFCKPCKSLSYRLDLDSELGFVSKLCSVLYSYGSGEDVSLSDLWFEQIVEVMI